MSRAARILADRAYADALADLRAAEVADASPENGYGNDATEAACEAAIERLSRAEAARVLAIHDEHAEEAPGGSHTTTVALVDFVEDNVEDEDAVAAVRALKVGETVGLGFVRVERLS